MKASQWTDANQGIGGLEYFILAIDAQRLPTDPVWKCTLSKDYGCFQPHNAYATGLMYFQPEGTPYAGYARMVAGSAGTTLKTGSTRLSTWQRPTEVWVNYWRDSWVEQHRAVGAVVGTDLTIVNGSWIGEWKAYYCYNILEELTEPGEYYLDKTTGDLYLWPTSALTASSDIVISTIETVMLVVSGAQHLSIRDISIESGRKEQVQFTNCQNVTLERTNFMYSGGSVLTGTNCTNFTMQDCEIKDSGHRAVTISGGVQATITKSGNVVKNCLFENAGRFQFSGIHSMEIIGCGGVVTKNTFRNSPDRAIVINGSEVDFTLNLMDNLLNQCGDAGCVYTSRWTRRGIRVKNNVFANIKSRVFAGSSHGIYVDDAGQGIVSEGNIFYNIDGSSHKFSGRDIMIFGNIVSKCSSRFWILDNLNYASVSRPDASYVADLVAVNYKQDPWLSRYPAAARIPTWAEVTAAPTTWLVPAETMLFGNCCHANGATNFQQGTAATRAYLKNISTLDVDNYWNTDPLMADPANGDFTISDSSPAYSLPGFAPIPTGDIGCNL